MQYKARERVRTPMYQCNFVRAGVLIAHVCIVWFFVCVSYHYTSDILFLAFEKSKCIVVNVQDHRHRVVQVGHDFF